MDVERQRVQKIPANKGSVCLFVPILFYTKLRNGHKYHNNSHRNLKFVSRAIFALHLNFSIPNSLPVCVIGAAQGTFSATNVAS